MPVIRVDEEVYEALCSLAKPFVDTPNSVLRRALGIVDVSRDEDDSPADSIIKMKKVRLKRKRIGSIARDWFKKELSNPYSSLCIFLKDKNLSHLTSGIYPA
jgi:negative regulator of replication initiation